MTDLLRNMAHEDWDYFGDPRVGIPAEDCSGLLAEAAQEFPGQLLRFYVTAVSPMLGYLFAEDGSIIGTQTVGLVVTGTLYVDGNSVGTRQVVLEVSVSANGPVAGSDANLVRAAVFSIVTPLVR